MRSPQDETEASLRRLNDGDGVPLIQTIEKNMNFPLITIPDPVAVGEWLDQEVPQVCPHRPAWRDGFTVYHWRDSEYFVAHGATPDDLLAEIRAQIASYDPLAKLRKEWEAMGKPDLNTRDQPR